MILYTHSRQSRQDSLDMVLYKLPRYWLIGSSSVHHPFPPIYHHAVGHTTLGDSLLSRAGVTPQDQRTTGQI